MDTAARKTIYYKFLTEDSLGPASVWNWGPYLPKNGKPGAWTPWIKTLEACRSGYHYTSFAYWRNHISHSLFVFEAHPDAVQRDGGDKFVTQCGRLVAKVKTWNDENLRLFAADCAERVLGLFEMEFPNDKCPRHVIEVARLYAMGGATRNQLHDAFRNANMAAAGVSGTYRTRVARAAARAAASAANAAAHAAAYYTAVHARAAASAAAYHTSLEEKWQDDTLAKRLGLTASTEQSR